ncbi:hypothetical protein [Candidatus Reidiella endopervernicosa]|uniref:hypothetical protein n=1 Tax=Candidatus Reidiella endopervernicosa TaxID=2738883 RepID=UPI001F2BB6B9|nr:hypothetical protein [Candidatus Reidiella endopervernicosa]
MRKFVLGIQAQANSKNFTRPFMPAAPRPSCVRCVITSSRLYTTSSLTLRRHLLRRSLALSTTNRQTASTIGTNRPHFASMAVSGGGARQKTDRKTGCK